VYAGFGAGNCVYVSLLPGRLDELFCYLVYLHTCFYGRMGFIIHYKLLLTCDLPTLNLVSVGRRGTPIIALSESGMYILEKINTAISKQCNTHFLVLENFTFCLYFRIAQIGLEDMPKRGYDTLFAITTHTYHSKFINPYQF
jgi:hypothetical protein